MARTSFIVALACLTGLGSAVKGGTSPYSPVTYSSGSSGFAPFPALGGATSLSSASYQYTGLGSAESNIAIAPDGTLIYSPAISPNGSIGYATSQDHGATWTQVFPGGSAQPRAQPVFTRRASSNRYFFWSTSGPGLYFSYSDDYGKTWTNLNGTHFDPLIQDWAKLVGGKPVRSALSNGAKEILYLSAPSLISTPIPVQPLGPINQLILKSLDGGATWSETKGKPTLQPLLAGGNCGTLNGINSYADQELIIWGDGFVTPNGTVMYGLRRCRALSLAISDDEGDSWRLVDVPGSSLPPFVIGDITYLFNGNVLVPEPISQALNGDIYAIWVDNNYVLQMSRSTDNAHSWSTPVVISAPGALGSNIMSYLPTLRQHPTQLNRAVLAYYGSSDNGSTYDAYIAETNNLNARTPTWTSIIGNPPNAHMQANQGGGWDQGYGDPLYDLVEFCDVRWTNDGRDWVASFARKMCSGHSLPPQLFNASSCVDGWNYTAQGQSAWQGFVVLSQH